MAIIASLSDNKLSYNSVKMAHKIMYSNSCKSLDLVPAQGSEPQKQLLTEHSVFSKPRYFHSNAL